MRRTRMAAAAALLLALPLVGGCDRGTDGAADAAGEGSMDGLSSDQIRQQAEPMSPEQAEELGIIDTTIHMEQLTSPGDSALQPGMPQPVPRDTAS